MSKEMELPEYQIFHVLRIGEQDPIGPFSQNQLVELLNEKTIKANDYVYYPELTGWKPLSQVFDLHQRITNFGDDGQDPQVVADSFTYVTNHGEPDEEIYYIAVQHTPAMSLTAAVHLASPRSVILTSSRVCVITPKLIGEDKFEEYPIEQIERGLKKIKSDSEHGLFNLVLKNGDWVEIDRIPAAQLTHLVKLTEELIAYFDANH